MIEMTKSTVKSRALVGSRIGRVGEIMLVAAAFLVFGARGVRAQYMYLDTNGDGIHTVCDQLNKSAPTTIDIWLDTDSNRDGSPATCAFGAGALDLSGYEVILQPVGGTITWGPMTNHMAGMDENFARDARDTTGTSFYHNGWSKAVFPPGLYRLASLVATIATGNPRVDIVTRNTAGRGARTSFGTACPANAERDHRDKLGYNWFDADGILPNAPPQVVAPDLMLPQDGAQVVVDVTASDPESEPIISLTADLSGLPAGNDAVFTPDGTNTAGELTWTPTVNDSGNYFVKFGANDCLLGTRTTLIHVIGAAAGVGENEATPPAFFGLAQNRPNPFNPTTLIEFNTPSPGRARLVVYDLAGRLVRELVNEVMIAGKHSARWSGEDSRGRAVGSGIYWYRLETGGLSSERRMVLLR
jgi:hypothetical protein